MTLAQASELASQTANPPQKESVKAFRLASMFGPVPAKLVKKIQALQYIDMKELLPDNIRLLRHMEPSDPLNALVPMAPRSRPRLREVNSILSWALCFISYLAVLAESHPSLVRPRLAYFALIISEARRNGGEGWLSYDTIFRQNAAEDEAADWTRLDSSLHAATFMAQSSAAGLACPYCSASDHSARECALRPLAGSTSYSGRYQGGTQPTVSGEREAPRQRAVPSSFPICIRWNKGDCFSPTCCYRHSCATCPGTHQAYLCPATPPTSFYKRGGPKASNRPLKPSS